MDRQRPRSKKGVGTRRHAEWSRGYYCAVAVLLRETGCASSEVRSLFEQGGGVEHADPEDVELFREHGLLPKHGQNQRQP